MEKRKKLTATLDSTNCNKTRCYEKNPKSVEGECEEVKEGGREREREGEFNHNFSSQRREATVANMNYGMISGCKMEINPGDYTAHSM